MNETTWFTEKCLADGSAFSLKLVKKAHEEQTSYQKIEIYETEKFGYLMVIDGCTMLSTRDNFLYHEMMSHPALFTHANPERVLIIGGGDCGTLNEVLKHKSVQQAWQVDIDERVTRLAEIYFPELCANNHDPRATLAFADGVQWIRDCDPYSLDVIIIDSTDPVGFAEGLFKEDFYRDCVRALKTDGVLVQQTESPLYHHELIKNTHHAMQQAGLKQTHLLHFPQPIYPSGWWSATLASPSINLAQFREQDAANKRFPTKYYNANVHRGALAMPEFLK